MSTVVLQVAASVQVDVRSVQTVIAASVSTTSVTATMTVVTIATKTHNSAVSQQFTAETPLVTLLLREVQSICDENVCMCVSVCLSVCPLAELINCVAKLHRIFVYVDCGLGSVLL